MAISVLNHGSGPSSSYVEDMEFCRTLKGNLDIFIFEIVSEGRNSLDPTLGCLYGKEGDHGDGAVIIVERSPAPVPRNDVWSCVVIEIVNKIFTPNEFSSVIVHF